MLGLGVVGTIIVIVLIVWLIRRVIRLGVQSCWPGVDPIAVPGSSVGVHAPGTRVSSASGMSYGRCRF